MLGSHARTHRPELFQAGRNEAIESCSSRACRGVMQGGREGGGLACLEGGGGNDSFL